MKVSLYACLGVAFLVQIASRLAPSPDLLSSNISLADIGSQSKSFAQTAKTDDNDEDDEEDDSVWEYAKCRGLKLLMAMMLDPISAVHLVTPIHSPWDGTLEHELKTWGYTDASTHEYYDHLCDFDRTGYQMMEPFEALGINVKSSLVGGPNHCFVLQHRQDLAAVRPPDNPLPRLEDQRYEVEGKQYRVTNLPSHHIQAIYPANTMVPFPGHRCLLHARRQPRV